ncbi:MAG: trypsin-like peptidase domain-containing protein, partial [Bacillota bacterium]
EGRVRHTFPDLSPGRCAVRVEAEGYHSSSRTVDIEPGGHVRFDGIVLQAEGEMFTAEEVAERALPATVTVIDGGGSLGSGFHIGDEMVVTNYHVIEGGVGLSVRAHDGEQYPVGGVAAADVDCDLAVLVVPGLEIPHLELSDDGQVRAGQTVVAVGSPLGLAGTVSAGIVSAPSREILGQSFIQTTAPISPGSSGSPLLDLYGRVVGVITMAAVDPAVQTINFAIPSSRVIELVEGAGAAEDLPGAEDSSAEVLSVGELDAWLAEVTGDTLFEFSLVTAVEDGDAVFFYLWVRAGDDCQQLLGITATEEGTSTVEQLLREIAGFIFANTQRPTAGTIVCWDRWRYYPQVLADAGWEVYGEPGDWISSRSLVWVYLWEADDCLVEWWPD